VFDVDFDLVRPMAPSKKSKKAQKQPPAHRTFRIIGPRPVEEEEESSESDFDPPSPWALINNVEPQAEEDQDSGEGNTSDKEHEEEISGEEEGEEEEDEEEDEDEQIQVPMKRKQVPKNANKSSFNHTPPLFVLPLTTFHRENSEDRSRR